MLIATTILLISSVRAPALCGCVSLKAHDEKQQEQLPDNVVSSVCGSSARGAADWNGSCSGSQPVVRILFVSVQQVPADVVVAASMIGVQPCYLHATHPTFLELFSGTEPAIFVIF